MFKLSKKHAIMRASLVGALIVAVLSTVAYYFINQFDESNAITQNNANVTVVYYNNDKDWYYYGSGTTESGEHHTRHYGVKTGSKTYEAYCAQPSGKNPTTHNPTRPATQLSDDTMKNKKIKLIMYLRQYLKTDYNSIKETIFGEIEGDKKWGYNNGDSTVFRRIYAFTHAVIGAIYAGDYAGINGSSYAYMKEQVDETAAYLETLINDNSPVWVAAQNYQLYVAKYSGSQDVVWLEPNYSISTSAADATDGDKYVEAGSSSEIIDSVSFCAAPGYTYTLKGVLMDKETGAELLINGQKVETSQTITPTERCNQVDLSFSVDTTSIAGKSVVAYQSLDYEDMSIIAHADINDAAQTVDIVSISTSAIDYPEGDKYVEADAASQVKDTVSYCAKAGQTYTIKGTLMDKATGQPLMINGQKVEKSITVKPTTNCSQADIIFQVNASDIAGKALVAFERLYLGETLIAKHEDLNDAAQTVDVVSIDTVAVDNADGDKYVEASTTSQVKDTVSYCVKPGQTYTIKGILMDKATNAPLNINGQTFEQSVEITPTTSCGQIEIIFPIDTTSIAGKSIVSYEQVYLGNTLITKHEDINDEAQTVTVVSVTTNAVDNADGDKYIEASETSKVKDIVSYCVKPGQTYTIKGTLMDKETGEPLMINDQKVEKSITINPTTSCGQAEIIFSIDTTEITGKSIVAFEQIYYNNQIITKHEDLNDEAQTLNIAGIDTEAVDDADGDRFIEASTESKVKDIVSYCVKPGQTYTIKGILMDKETGEALTIDGQTFEQSIEITPTEECGEEELVFEIDTTSIAGKSIVAFEQLYLGNTLVTKHEDINDEAQTVTVIYIETYATDKETGKKIIPYDSDVTIRDHVKYCLKPGIEYTIKGIVMDKSTGNGLLVNSETVEQEYTFTPTKACDEFDIFYTLNTTGLGGADLVIFDRLYLDDELILDHNDIDNASQSFAVELPVPETGFSTKEANNGQASSGSELYLIAVIAIAPVGIYAMSRRRARNHFLSK